MTKPDDVVNFLRTFKQLSKSPDHLVLLRKHPGSKNLECLLQLGITERQAKEIVLGLSLRDYSKGPEEDRDREGQKIWIFCPYITGRQIYVKLVVHIAEANVERAKILSFHFAEYPMSRPFAQKT